MPRKEQVRRLDIVYVFANGMVMAFDQRSRQWPEYQGKRDDVLPKIKRDYPNVLIKEMDGL